VSEPFSAEAEAVIASLRAELAQRDGVIAQREVVIEQLLERVAVLEARSGKNSKNSSKPPSTDNPFTKPTAPTPRSLRKKSGLRPGKQSGEPGAWLEPVEVPDQIRVHAPECCGRCGGDLGDAEVVEERVRQVFDLPPIRVEVTEHRAQTRRCPRAGCGQETTAAFPRTATAPTCYGPRVAALGAYLLARQHVPVDRAAETLADCFGVDASTGWLAGLLPRAEAGLAGFAKLTQAHLRAAPVAHFDETGARVAGTLWWVHVACTDKLTHYHRASGRGSASANLGGVLPGFTGVAVHDGLSSYRSYEVDHALCNAHHLRELVELDESHHRRGITDITWPQDMIDLLVAINTAVTNAKAAGHTRLEPHRWAGFQRRYRDLVALGWRAHPRPAPTGKQGRPKLGTAGSLVRRLEIYQADVLRFATDFRVPFDNNQAERDIRMIRIQQKISGSWRSEAGADAFLAVRSYLATARKQHRNALDVLRDLFTGTPWLPAAT
jgi:transposase